MESQPYAFREPGTDPKLPPLLLFFSEAAVRNDQASKAGPVVYDRVVRVRIAVAGMKDSPIYEIVRVAEDGTEKIDRDAYRRFGEIYEQWKAKRSPANAGTPLEQWPLMDVVLVAKFKDAHIYTVQDLAACSDAGLDTIRGMKGREWRAKAQAWLADAHDAAAAVEKDAKIAALEERLAAMEQMLKDSQRKSLGQDRPRSRTRETEAVVAVDEAEARL